MERLDFSETTKYSAEEAAIHLGRYLLAQPYVKDKKVLDAACGEGYGSKLMLEWGAADVTGIDISQESIQKAERIFGEEHLRYLAHTVEQLPFEDNTFDLIVSLETIEHVDHPESFLREIARVLKPNGTVIISCPNDHYYAEKDSQFCNPYHKRRYSFSEFSAMTTKHLGEHVVWSFCYSLRGFMVMSHAMMQCRKEAVATSMLDMMDAQPYHGTYVVPYDSELTADNSNYYVGIWNGSEEAASTIACFPNEYFVKPDNLPYEYAGVYQSNTQLTEQVRAEYDKLQDECARLQKSNKILFLENAEYVRKRAIEVEKRERLSELYVKETSLMTALNNKLRDELSAAHNEISSLQNQLELVYRSTSFKMGRAFWRFRQKVKALFRLKH